MSETSKKIIEEIHERHVTHRPRWYFLAKDISVWITLAAAIFFGALALSIEEAVIEKGLAVHNAAAFTDIGFLFRGASLLWILCTALFVVLAYLNLRHVKDGYRFRAAWIAIGIVFVIVTLGLLLRQEGLGNKAESAFEHNAFYHSVFRNDIDDAGGHL